VKRIFLSIATAVVLVAAGAPTAAADGPLGIVLMHGKSSTAEAKSPIGKLARILGNNGFLVATPEMAWSRSRVLDKDYEAALAEIDDAVARLRGMGAERIVVGGHSMGANAAIGYGARRGGLAGILAIAPGHVPDVTGFQNKTDHDYRRAMQMVAAGRGAEMAAFNDFNEIMGDSITVRADVYLSWFDPEGPAIIPKNAAALRPGTALMWVIGENDNMLQRGDDEGYAFNKAPTHPKSLYVVVPGGHKWAPVKGKKEIIAWLKGL